MITVKRKVQFTREAKGRRRIAKAATQPKPVEPGRVPRISRLMALAIKLERLLQSGEVSGLDELARLGHVTQPRMTQILALTHLAPDIQEELLFLPRVAEGKAAIHEKMLRPIAAEIKWNQQRRMWLAVRNISLRQLMQNHLSDSTLVAARDGEAQAKKPKKAR